jgi:GDP-mannose 6-dehydrogenase
VLGLSFKRGTDDLRESPLVELVERIIGRGHSVRIHDENVMLSKLVGGNKAYIQQKLPHLAELLIDDLDALFHNVDVVIAGAHGPGYRDALVRLHPPVEIVDLVRLIEGTHPNGVICHGLCW